MTSPGPVPGLHHVSAICSDPQRNLDFYVGLLGLRLVKKTVNFDDPLTYHLYYGDGVGTPGTLLTFFAWISVPPMVIAQGRQGSGQIVTTSLSVPAGSLDWWVDRLAAAAVDFGGPFARFDERVLTLEDPDGLPLELVARAEATAATPWSGSPVPAEHAIRGVGGVALCLEGYERTAELLTGTLGFSAYGNEGNRFRFRAGHAALDLLCAPDSAPGRMGTGVVHHVAWRVADEAEEDDWRAVLFGGGQDPTPVLDRRYFRSIYFREPGGVLFELATDGPGFAVDEPPDALGGSLQLPPWLEERRARIEARLPELRAPRG
jgi:glyoxalase family protein